MKISNSSSNSILPETCLVLLPNSEIITKKLRLWASSVGSIIFGNRPELQK